MSSSRSRRRRRRPGPRPDVARMERAARLALAGWPLADIARLTGVPYSTAADWRDMPEWTALLQRLSLSRGEQLSYAAHELVTREFRRALEATRADRRTLERAVRILELLHGSGDGEVSTGLRAQIAIVALPKMDTGQPSLPPGEAIRRGIMGEQPSAEPREVRLGPPAVTVTKRSHVPSKPPRGTPARKRQVAVALPKLGS